MVSVALARSGLLLAAHQAVTIDLATELGLVPPAVGEIIDGELTETALLYIRSIVEAGQWSDEITVLRDLLNSRTHSG